MRKHLSTLSLGLFGLTVLGLTTHVAAAPQSTEEQEQQQVEAMFQGHGQEEDVYRAQEMLVTATGSLKPLRLAPSVATVITAEQIEEIGATTLDQILETVPGLHVSPSSVNLFSSTWSVRGIATKMNPQVLLLLNGVPMTDNVNGTRIQTFQMPVAMISRVEVVRGPGSAVYGADAFAGTINVITKDGHEVDGTRTGVRYGSFDTTDAWAQHGGTYAGWDLAASVETQKSQGDDNRIVKRDGLGSGFPSLAPGPLDTRSDITNVQLSLNKKDRLVFHGYGQWQNDNGIGPGVLQILNDDSSVSNSQQFYADLTYNAPKLGHDWDLSLQANVAYQNVENSYQFFPSSLPNALSTMRGDPEYLNLNGGLEAVSFFSGFTDHRIRLATGLKSFDTDTDDGSNFTIAADGSIGIHPWRNLKGTPDIYMENQHRSLCYLSAQDEWHLAKGWELTGGVRYDNYNDFGSTINPRLALVWETRYDLTTKLMYGRAFRAPSFGEQAFQNNPATIGNPNLDPETIDTYELAEVWEPTKDITITPSIFYYEINGLIDYVADPAPAITKTAQNAKDQVGHGFELDANWDLLKSLRLRANLAYQRSKDAETDALVPDTPEWQAYANAHWSFLPDWSLDGQYFWISDRHRADGDSRDAIDDYSLVNLTLRRKNIAKHWDAALAVRNLFDQDVREPSDGIIPNDYPMESRAIWGELQLHF